MQGHERDAGQAYQSVASALSGARTAAEAAAETPPEAAAEVPAEPAATIPTHAPQGAENPEPRPPEPAPPISWLD
jgi:hypothetical protein